MSDRATQVGVLCAVSAHVMWGLFPLYWRLLDSISPVTLTAHRVVWSFVLLVLLTAAMPRLRKTLGYLRDWQSLMVCGGAAAMIALNWGAFMYAVGNDQVLQASLGYYINPLLNVLLVLGGLVSVMPLALFAVAAKRVTLSTIGILQYVGPTLQWFVGVFLFGESFAGSKLIGFLFVWAGVIVFVVGGLMTQSRASPKRSGKQDAGIPTTDI